MKFWLQMRWLWLRSLRYRFRSWIRRVLDVPARGEVEAIYMKFDVECRDRIRYEAVQLGELLTHLTREVKVLSDTVKMLALWTAKHDVEQLERGINETHASRE